MALRDFVEDRPTAQTIVFAGQHINLRRLAAAGPFDKGHLSRILSGQKNASLPYFTRIAKLLELDLDELAMAILDRKMALSGRDRARLAS